MFQLTDEEWKNQRSQIVIFNKDVRKYKPYAFTEQGVSMLSGGLKYAFSRLRLALYRVYRGSKNDPKKHRVFLVVSRQTLYVDFGLTKITK